MTAERTQQIGRLAMREEGQNWNAYYALTGTMKGAIFLGSIKLRFVQTQPRRAAFMNLMRECVGDIIEETVGVRPTWGGAKPAPESERAGNA